MAERGWKLGILRDVSGASFFANGVDGAFDV